VGIDEVRLDLAHDRVDQLDGLALLRHRPVAEVAPEQACSQYLGSVFLLAHPRASRLRPLLTRGHDQQGDAVPARRVSGEGCAAAQLDIVGMGSDGQNVHR